MRKTWIRAGVVGLTSALLLAGCGQSSTDATYEKGTGSRNSAPGTVGSPAPGSPSGSKSESTTDYYSEADVCTESAYEDSYASGYYDTEYPENPDPNFNTEEYDSIDENNYISVSKQPLSTFAADVDTGSYSNFRRMVNDGYDMDDIPSGAIRIEEMINYFDYTVDDKHMSDGAFSVQYETGVCPWNEQNGLLMMTVQANPVETVSEGGNFVFLIDTSGSMTSKDKIDLAVKAFKKFAKTLNENDRVSVVTYAGDTETLIAGAHGDDTDEIEEALDAAKDLCYGRGGGTNGSGGITAAYQVAEDNFIKGGVNRVIIASDGDMNLGISDNSGLVDLITEKKETGIFLTTLGFGSGNYSDYNMESIADAGNGNYYYIDSIEEARRVLVEKVNQTTVTVAKDVKFQAEFNPMIVSKYRLIGYENRVMSADDFEDDTKDGGEVGAGQQVTVLYELVYSDGEVESSDLKYQQDRKPTDSANSNEVCTVSIRYKDPDADKSKLEEYPVSRTDAEPSDDFQFASAVVEASLVITGSDNLEGAKYENALSRAKEHTKGDEWREQFVDLLEDLK